MLFSMQLSAYAIITHISSEPVMLTESWLVPRGTRNRISLSKPPEISTVVVGSRSRPRHKAARVATVDHHCEEGRCKDGDENK